MLTVRDLMRPDPLTLEPEETLRSAVDALVSAGTGGAPVVSGGKLVGVISLSDVLAFEADAPGVPRYRPENETPPEGTAPDDGQDAEAESETGRWFTEMWDDAGADLVSRWESDGPEWDELDQHSVAEVMTRRVVHVGPDDAIGDAARVMDRAGVHRLIVTERGSVVGVLGARDVVHAVAQGLLVPHPPSGGGG